MFSTCGSAPVAMCQYCARPFCPAHGVVQEDGQEVCNRKECIAKREDLVVHLAYKELAQDRNAEQKCGIEGCEYALAGRCTRCQAYYCETHVGRREDVYLVNKVRMRRMATLCHHCWARREIWLKT